MEFLGQLNVEGRDLTAPEVKQLRDILRGTNKTIPTRYAKVDLTFQLTQDDFNTLARAKVLTKEVEGVPLVIKAVEEKSEKEGKKSKYFYVVEVPSKLFVANQLYIDDLSATVIDGDRSVLDKAATAIRRHKLDVYYKEHAWYIPLTGTFEEYGDSDKDSGEIQVKGYINSTNY